MSPALKINQQGSEIVFLLSSLKHIIICIDSYVRIKYGDRRQICIQYNMHKIISRAFTRPIHEVRCEVKWIQIGMVNLSVP